jgi:hypothetical protein
VPPHQGQHDLEHDERHDRHLERLGARACASPLSIAYVSRTMPSLRSIPARQARARKISSAAE